MDDNNIANVMFSLLKEESVFIQLKLMDGDITLRQLQAEMKEDGATNDDITKGVWKWLQHNKQD